jgi:ribonuclease HI
VLKFTRRRTKGQLLKLAGRSIPFSREAKHLGVTIDDKLTWKSHCTDRAKKGIMALAVAKRAIGPTWGLKPKIALWIYKAIVRPMLEYGSLVWCSATTVKARMKELERVQRVALLSTTGTMRSTPTASLECLLGIAPIDIRIRQVALQTMHRLSLRNQWLGWYGRGFLSPLSHMDLCDRMAREIPEMAFPCDKLDSRVPTERNFSVKIRSRRDWENNGLPPTDPNTYICYTDGSRIGGSAGAAYHVMTQSQPEGVGEGLKSLGTHATVFQGEVMALIEVGHFLKGTTADNINIYVDSSSVLKSLVTEGTTSALVLEAFEIMEEVGNGRTLKLEWIPAHTGYEGNERADVLAKRAAETCPCGPQPIVPLSPSVVKLTIREWSRNLHRLRWKDNKGCKQSKIFLGGPCGNPRDVIRLPRNSLRLLTQVVTGHNTLNYHLFKMGLAPSSICLCELGEETGLHFMGECDIYAMTRLAVLGGLYLTAEELSEVPFTSLARYIARTGRFNKNSERYT